MSMNSNMKSITQRQEKRWLFWMNIGKRSRCHQMKERSFFYGNFQFPVCARCTGIYIGQFIIAPISWLLQLNFLYLNIIFVFVLAADGLLQHFDIKESNNPRRLITGLLGGYGFMMLLIQLFIFTIKIFL